MPSQLLFPFATPQVSRSTQARQRRSEGRAQMPDARLLPQCAFHFSASIPPSGADTPLIPPHPLCPYCGEPENVDFLEIWSDHSFALECCCEALQTEILFELETGPEERLALMNSLDAAGHLGARSLRRVAESDGQWLLDCDLDIRPISFSAAKAFIARHHDHCPPPQGWRYGAAIWNGMTCVGVVTVGRPVARALPQYTWVEVNRLCVDRSLPDALRWKACSSLYTFAWEEAARRGFQRIITYTLETEDGMSLRYARWKPEHRTAGGSHSSKRRPRVDKTPTVPKIRWTRPLANAARLATT